MTIDNTTLARARLALRAATREFLFQPNVTLIDFGNPLRAGRLAEDELSIRIHVNKKLTGVTLESAVETGQTRPIPSYIGGFKTDVAEGKYRPHGWWDSSPVLAAHPRAARAEILRGGISISNEYHYSFGTLGGLVRDRKSGDDMLLSNWHVLAGRWGVQPGQLIYQPGRLDGGTRVDAIAGYTRDAMSTNLDAAVATLNGSRKLLTEQVGLKPVTGVSQAEIGMRVVKSGRKTGVTFGRVTAIEGIAKMNYDYVERIMRDIITIDSLSGEVSSGGDSGSWWLDAETMHVIGLHFAGSDYPERALAHDIQSVRDTLNIEIVASKYSPAYVKTEGQTLKTIRYFNY